MSCKLQPFTTRLAFCRQSTYCRHGAKFSSLYLTPSSVNVGRCWQMSILLRNHWLRAREVSMRILWPPKVFVVIPSSILVTLAEIFFKSYARNSLTFLQNPVFCISLRDQHAPFGYGNFICSSTIIAIRAQVYAAQIYQADKALKQAEQLTE